MTGQTRQSKYTAIVCGAIGAFCVAYFVLDQTPREQREITMEWRNDR